MMKQAFPRMALGFVALVFACTFVSAHAEPTKLTLIPGGVTSAYPGRLDFVPQKLALTTTKPAGIRKLPLGVTAPRFGVLKVGPKESPTTIFIVIDEPDKGKTQCYISGSVDGDLTDVPGSVWSLSAIGTLDTVTRISWPKVTINYKDAPAVVKFGMYFTDKNDTNPETRNSLFYYYDYAVEGTLVLGGKDYKVMLVDPLATGDFRSGHGVRFLIDVDGNGKFQGKRENYAIDKPFNIHGTTYELKVLSPSGLSIEAVKSKQTVAELPDLSPGNSAPTFTAKALDGKVVRFPSDYKGKLVLLDFWATWCGPCLKEMPNVLKAYEAYHAQGLEILSVSLDKTNVNVAEFAKAHGMPWTQVYDGKFWQAAIAKQYLIDYIPHAFLVDGNTGKIVAEGLRGENLQSTIQKAMKQNSQH